MRALNLVHLEEWAYRPAPFLSGGQPQRVALARALVAEPKWKGRFVLWDNGNPFDFIAVRYGKERALELARKFKTNKSILSRSAAILTGAK